MPEQNPSRFLAKQSGAITPISTLAVDTASIMIGDHPPHDSHGQKAAFERRQQTILIYMVSSFGITWLPMNVIALFHSFIIETNPTSAAVMDITYIIFIWIGFLSALTTPVFATILTSTNDRGDMVDFSYQQLRQRVSSYLLRSRRPSDAQSLKVDNLTPKLRSNSLANISPRTRQSIGEAEKRISGHYLNCDYPSHTQLLPVIDRVGRDKKSSAVSFRLGPPQDD